MILYLYPWCVYSNTCHLQLLHTFKPKEISCKSAIYRKQDHHNFSFLWNCMCQAMLLLVGKPQGGWLSAMVCTYSQQVYFLSKSFGQGAMLDDGAAASVLGREDCFCAAVAKLRMPQLWMSPSEGLTKWCYCSCGIPDLVTSCALGSWEYAAWSCTSRKQSLTGSTRCHPTGKGKTTALTPVQYFSEWWWKCPSS